MAADPDLLADIDNRIAILRDNLRELVDRLRPIQVQQMKAFASDRIASQQAKLDELLAERDRLTEAK